MRGRSPGTCMAAVGVWSVLSASYDRRMNVAGPQGPVSRREGVANFLGP